MIFYSRWGYLVVVFFVVAAFIAGGISTAYHLSPEFNERFIVFVLGTAMRRFRKKSRHSGKA